MKCSVCGKEGSKVVETRAGEDGRIRRRRECPFCGTRFTTFEAAEDAPLMVIKKDKTRQPFVRDKLRAGVLRACVKRPVSAQEMDCIVNEVERYCYSLNLREITSEEIGEMVLNRLREIDVVSYIRFASVYRDFTDLDSFLAELKYLREKQEDSPK